MAMPTHQFLPFKVSAPGKIILYGEHSVVYGKLALAATLGLRTQITIEPSNDDVILQFLTLNLTKNFELKQLKTEIFDKIQINYENPELINHLQLVNQINTYLKQSKSDHLTSLFYLMAAILNDVTDLSPFLLKVSTDLTISSGIGSSASYLVTLAAAFLLLRKSLPNLIKFDDFDLDLIRKWSFEAEKIYHGTPSGIDNTICTYGGLLKFQKGSKFELLKLPMTANLKILLINSNIKRDTKVYVDLVRNLYEKHKTIINCVFNAINEITKKALETIQSSHDLNNDLSDLIDLNQNLLRCLNVSHPKLEEIVNILHKFKLAGKLTGAGGGGYAVSVVPIDYVGIDLVINELEQNGFSAILTDIGGVGVRID